MLAEVASRAAAQNVSMLSLMLAPDAGEAPRFASEKNITWINDLPAMRDAYVNAGIRQVAENGKRNLDKFEDRRRKLLKCGTPSADPGCRVIVRYQYEVHRGLAPEQVFAEMMTGFEMASMDSRVLNVNPVMPEDAYVETRDFDLHMRMFDYLKSLYPKVRLSLHAGELWPGLVPPEGLRHHIRDSIHVGHAERIGHGVDVMFEDNPFELLKEMAAKKIMVEINLTSNDKILGVRGDEHPLTMYLKFGVPVAISTDDEGVSRSDMTQEYWRAVRTYKLPYKILKNHCHTIFVIAQGNQISNSFQLIRCIAHYNSKSTELKHIVVIHVISKGYHLFRVYAVHIREYSEPNRLGTFLIHHLNNILIAAVYGHIISKLRFQLL
jgi:hypothetical protein